MKLNHQAIPVELLEAPDLTVPQLQTLKNIQSAILIALSKSKDGDLVEVTLLMSELLVFGMKAVANNMKFEPEIKE